MTEQRPDAVKLARMRLLSLIIDIALIGGCAYLLAADINAALGDAPAYTSRGVRFMLNLTATFAIVYRGMMLAQRLLPEPQARARRPILILKWVLVLSLPILVGAQIERMTYQAHLRQLDRTVIAVAPIIQHAINAHRPLQASDLQALDRAMGASPYRNPYLVKVFARTDTGVFLLTAQVPWLGVDPLIGNYLSSQGVWQINPGDDEPDIAAGFAANSRGSICHRDQSGWSCEK
jgi:hypothetical protein